MLSPSVRVAVAESPNSDLSKVNECWDLWGMKLSVSKTKTIIVSWSLKMPIQSSPFILGEAAHVLKKSNDLNVLGVRLDFFGG